MSEPNRHTIQWSVLLNLLTSATISQSFNISMYVLWQLFCSVKISIISLTYDSLNTSQHQYLGKLINIKPAGSTRSSNHLTLLRLSNTCSLKISNLSYHRTSPILWNNLPKSMRTFCKTSPNYATNSQCSSLQLSLSKTQFCSHLKTYLFGILYPP